MGYNSLYHIYIHAKTPLATTAILHNLHDVCLGTRTFKYNWEGIFYCPDIFMYKHRNISRHKLQNLILPLYEFNT